MSTLIAMGIFNLVTLGIFVVLNIIKLLFLKVEVIHLKEEQLTDYTPLTEEWDWKF